MRDPDVLDSSAFDPSALGGLLPGARNRHRWTSIRVLVEPLGDGLPPSVRYRWDADTEILTASIDDQRGGGAAATALELEGPDGSWVTLELRGGRFCGLELAVWPPVRLRTVLSVPTTPTAGHVSLPGLQALGGMVDVEVDTLLEMEADRKRRAYHLRVGRPRASRAVRVARDIFLEVDTAGELAGLWLLHVPPQPHPH